MREGEEGTHKHAKDPGCTESNDQPVWIKWSAFYLDIAVVLGRRQRRNDKLTTTVS